MKSQSRNKLNVAFQGRYSSLGGHVPNLNPKIGGARDGEAVAMRMPGNDVIVHGADRELSDALTACQVVHRCGWIFQITHGDFLAVWMEGQGVGLRGD